MDQIFGCVSLDAACKVLAKSLSVRQLIEKELNSESAAAVMEMMACGELAGDIGDEVHDLLVDEVLNHSTEVWSGVIRQPHGDFPVRVNDFHGVYWVWALEVDPIGYFLDRVKAIDCAKSNWGDVEVHQSGGTVTSRSISSR